VLYFGKKSLRGSTSRNPAVAITSFVLLIALLLSPILNGIRPEQASAASSLRLIAPVDKTVAATGSTTQVGLGTAKIFGASDSTVTISNTASGFTPAPAGAVAFWSFDDDLVDHSGSRNDGVAEGDARIIDSSMGKALKLDGDGDYVQVDDNWNLDITGAFTISAWIKFDTLNPDANYARIIEKGTSPGNKYWMFYVKSSKTVGFGFKNTLDEVSLKTAKTDWQTGKWYQIVGTYDPKGGSNNMKIYVNGILDSQSTQTALPEANNAPLMIGAKNPAIFDFWQGVIDEVRIYRKALSASEVTSLYKSPFVSLKAGTNLITWKATDSATSAVASAVQVVNVVPSSTTATPPKSSLAINGVRYVDGTSGNTFVTSASHFDLKSQDFSGSGIKSTNFRYIGSDELIRPSFKIGTYLQIDGADGEYITQFYAIDNKGNVETLNQKNVVLDNTSPRTSLNVIAGTSKVRLAATDNYQGSGIGGGSASGIYYKLDSASTYTFVQGGSVDVPNVVNGAHTIYYYSVDNLGNKEAVKSSKYTGVVRSFCNSGCEYNNLQNAINSLPTGGGKITIGSGSYTLTNSITLKSGTILDFSSSSSIYFRGDSIPVFKGNGVSNVEIIGGAITTELAGSKAFAFTTSSGIKITGSKTTTVPGGNSNAFYCSDCTNVFIKAINAKSASRLIDIKTSSGLTDGKSSQIWIENSFFDTASIEGVKVNHSNDVHIIGNSVTKTFENGIDIGWNEDSEVRGNKLTSTGMTNAAAIHTDSANGANIINNYIDTTGQTAIPVYRASNINLIENTIINAGGSAISIITLPEPSANIKVKLNHITSPIQYGIYVSPEQSQVEISFNTIEDSPTGSAALIIAGSNPSTLWYANTIQ